MRSRPKAYFVTWTCRGTWLHGDRRGSVDRWHNRFRRPLLPPDRPRERDEEKGLGHPPWTMSPRDRTAVLQAIGRVSRRREWEVWAINVRSTHVHCVVRAVGVKPEEVMRQLKMWATRALKDSGRIAEGQSPWTRHGSTRYLWEKDDLAGAVEYVYRWQDEPARWTS